MDVPVSREVLLRAILKRLQSETVSDWNLVEIYNATCGRCCVVKLYADLIDPPYIVADEDDARAIEEEAK